MCRVVVRLSKHPAVPPHDFVRSPGQMEFGEGPISARSPTEPLPKRVVSFDERPHRRNQWFRLGKRFASAFNRRNASSGSGLRRQDRTVSEM